MSKINSNVVLYTTYVSIIVQVITGLVSLQGITISLPPEHEILTKALALETIVQFVEFAFYIWFVLRFNLQKMAATRYFDWVITTPTMLFTTMLFMKYQSLVESKKDTTITITNFIKEHKHDIFVVFFANLFMLIPGYLGEIGLLNRYIATTIGFMFFYISFTVIYKNYAKYSELGKHLYTFLIVVWALYGVIYLLPVSEKNIGFNILDIIAKNFFGLYLFYKVNSLNNSLKNNKNDIKDI